VNGEPDLPRGPEPCGRLFPFTVHGSRISARGSMSTPRLTFWGAAGQVTGSMHLLEAAGARVLLDAGLFQGHRAEAAALNANLPFDARRIDAVVLSHAHMDHIGRLPLLVRHGYHGPIYATPATRDLAAVMLPDAAQIQESDAAYLARHGKKGPASDPLYTMADALAAQELIVGLPYRRIHYLRKNLAFEYTDAGHILGSAFVEIHAMADDNKSTTLVFSGDIGQYNAPLHPDPQALPSCDTLILESTYGDRLHDPRPLIEQIRQPFKETLGNGGIILIPAFAVARAQTVTFLLRELMDAGSLPTVPIHVDSPMAVDVTETYGRYLGSDELDAQLGGEHRRLFPHSVTFHRTVEESRRLNHLAGPRIIISSSGMLTGGRVLHHLRRLLPDRRNLLVLVGYQAAGTRGRALEEGARTLRMHGEDIPVRARFMTMDGLSAHADRHDLLRWLHSGPDQPRTIFISHGEAEAAKALAATVRSEGTEAIIPHLHQEFRFAPDSQSWRPA